MSSNFSNHSVLIIRTPVGDTFKIWKVEDIQVQTE